jgi:hypothetical protein
LEFAFTEPVAQEAGQSGKYEIKQWRYEATANYGGPKIDEHGLQVQSVLISQDRRKVYLEIDGLKEKHVVYVRLLDVKSESGHSLWATETWYTLNAFGTGNPFDPAAVKKTKSIRDGKDININRIETGILLHIPVCDTYTLKIVDIEGSILFSQKGINSLTYSVPVSLFSPGIFLLEIKSNKNRFVKKIIW